MGNGAKQHDKVFIFLLAFVVLLWVFHQAMSYLSGGPGVDIGWFESTTGGISRLYPVEIAPDSWAFSIWKIIYALQVIWIVYIIISIFRKNAFGPVYLNPPVVTSFFLAMFLMELALSTTWSFVWDRQLLIVALVVNTLYTISIYIMLISSHYWVNRYLPAMQKYHKWDLFWNRALIQNGVAVSATWVTIATFIQLAIVTTYVGGVNQSIACTVALSVLTCAVLCYFIMENFILERYLRYTYGVWVVIIWACSGIITKNWDPSNRNSIITATLLALSSALFVIKIGLSIWRARNKPI